jgi:magnesium-protoporphyrin IX monomethyl ester (oxidative) cyclase
MFVRDHTRPMLHEAMGLHSTEYDFAVFRMTNDITKQVFPVALDIDHPAFRAGLVQLFGVSQAFDAARERGGIAGKVLQGWHALRGLYTFGCLYFLPVVQQPLTPEIRMQPAW